MPRVPRYDEPQVDLRPVATVRQDASDLLGSARQLADTSRALGDAGESATRIARRAQERTDADMLFRAEAAADEASRSFETEALAAEGANAWGVHDKGRQWWDDAGRKFGDTLTSDRQQRLWGQSLERMRSASLDRLARHEAGQRRVSLKRSTNASIVGLVNAAAGDPRPDNIAAQRAEILKRRQVLADLEGETAEERAYNDGEAVSSLHAQVLEGLIARNPQEASRYLKDNRKEIAPDKVAAVDRAVRQGTLKTIAQEAADAAELAGMSEAEALSDARKRFEGEEESAVVAEVKVRFAEKAGAREADQRAAADEAYRIFAKERRLSAVPASVLARMDGKVLLELRREASGEKAVTDWARYAELREMARTDPRAFKALDLRKDFGHLAPAQREALLDLQGKDGAGVAEVRSVDSQIGATIRPLGLKAADAAVAEDAIRAEIDVEQRRRGGKLTQDERQKIIDRMLVQGEVLSGHWYQRDPDRRFFQVRPDERDRFDVKIPADDRDTIVRWYKENKGRVPTDYEVEQKYRQALGLR